MKKGKIFKTLAVFGICLCAPLLLTGCKTEKTPVELRVEGEYVQYYDGEQWKNLIAVEDLKGKDGDDGVGIDGKQVEFQKTATHIQWKYVGDSTWNDLIALDDISGEDALGIKDIQINNDGELVITYTNEESENLGKVVGENGISTNGKEVEFQKGATHIQWRYVGTTSWTNLIALSELKGKDLVAQEYTITYDYNTELDSEQLSYLFDNTKTQQTLKSNEWITDLPKFGYYEGGKEFQTVGSNSYFLGWFIKGTNKQVENYSFLGGDVVLEARYNDYHYIDMLAAQLSARDIYLNCSFEYDEGNDGYMVNIPDEVGVVIVPGKYNNKPVIQVNQPHYVQALKHIYFAEGTYKIKTFNPYYPIESITVSNSRVIESQPENYFNIFESCKNLYIESGATLNNYILDNFYKSPTQDNFDGFEKYVKIKDSYIFDVVDINEQYISSKSNDYQCPLLEYATVLKVKEDLEIGDYISTYFTCQEEQPFNGYVIYKRIPYTISTPSISHGSVSVDKKLGKFNDLVTATINADEGYELDKLIVKNGSKDLEIVSGNTFYIPAGFGNITVTAQFKPIT